MVAVVVTPSLRSQLEAAGLHGSITATASVSTVGHRAALSAGASLRGLELHLRHSDAEAAHAPPVPRCPRLEARMRALRARAADAEYARIVADVARSDARDGAAAAAVRQLREAGPQMSLAVNVIATMATCFAAGFFVADAATGSRSIALAAGLLGLIGAMGVEATLVMTRMYAIEKEAEKEGKRRERGVERRGIAAGQVVVGEGKRKEE